MRVVIILPEEMSLSTIRLLTGAAGTDELRMLLAGGSRVVHFFAERSCSGRIGSIPSAVRAGTWPPFLTRAVIPEELIQEHE
jgi:hypothetical protein